jgi:hypothetical protein
MTAPHHDRARQGMAGQPAAITAATIPLVLLPVELVLDHASEVGIIHTPPWDHCWVCPCANRMLIGSTMGRGGG